MIPAVMDAQTQSPGEHEVFKRLRDDPKTDGWTVLHSFNLPRHKTQIQGEADFVILAPGLGMLCLEVKAHRRVARDANGQWRLGGDPPRSRSPFTQAENNMRSLMSLLSERRKDLADALVSWHAVLFTHCEFRVPATEWNAWEVVDSREFHRRPISELIAGVLQEAREKLWHKALPGSPTVKECAAIATAFRPRFEAVQPASQRRAEKDGELRVFSEEQYAALDGMSRYRRVVFEGPAGTGKTLLALEAARRHAGAGSRVGLVCFNQFLGKWLADEAANINGTITAKTVHSLMLDVAGKRVPASGLDEFWSSLPEVATEHLLDSGAVPVFDVLVIDEAQDLLREPYLDVLDLMTVGGLASGNWLMFGDFERQALYDSDVTLDGFLASRAQAPVFGLRTNCRNTPRVARWVSMLAALDPAYARIRRPDTGPPPRTRYYSSEAEQASELAAVLTDLYSAGYEGSDIVVLSPRREGAASHLRDAPWRDRVKPYGADAKGHFVKYATVHSFKGMEAAVIILTDVSELQGERARALFYTAATRTTDRLIVLAERHLADELIDLLDRFETDEEQTDD